LANFIRRYSTKDDLNLLLKLRLKKAEQTRNAALEQLERIARPDDDVVVDKLVRSRRPDDTRLLCRILIRKDNAASISRFRTELGQRKLGSRILAIFALGANGDETDASHLTKRLKSPKLPTKERVASGHALARWAQTNGNWDLLAKLLHFDDPVCRGALAAIENRGNLKLGVLLKQYSRLPSDTAAAVLRTVSATDGPELEKFISATILKPETRDIIIALLKVGGNKAARWVLDLIGHKAYAVVFWNAPILAAALTKAMEIESKAWLCKLAESDEFWYYTENERTSPALPVESTENLYLFKRLAGVALASLCDQRDWPLLKKLIFHKYWAIQAAAADQVAKFAKVEHLNELVELARNEARDKPDPGVVNALALLDAKLFGQQD
jgi:hypothetical protein